jgi:predicted phosphodiesterase
MAIVSDVHGNRTAFEAVLSDLGRISPDVVLHGGDLCHGGSSPAEIVDRIRDLGWPGVVGNTDELLFRPASLTEFANQTPPMQPLVGLIEEMGRAAGEALGEERLAWLRGLPSAHRQGSVTLVHASPGDLWRAPAPNASDAELESVYSALEPIAIYAHIHCSFVRQVPRRIVANTGSVSLSYDGDCRAAYLLIDGGKLEIRRVEYDVEREIKALSECALPHADWIAKILRSALPQMP